MTGSPPPRNNEAPAMGVARASTSNRSAKGKDTMHPSNLQQKSNAASRRTAALSAHQTAVNTIGKLLVAYRVNGRPDQRAELVGMARMAVALGALDAETYAYLIDLISQDDAPAAPPAYVRRRAAGLEVH